MERTLLIGLLLLTVACQPADSAPAAVLTPSAPTRTPPAPASPSPAPTPSLTPIPTALPRFFIEEFEGSPPAWSLLQSNTDIPPQTRMQAGSLIFVLDSAYDWIYAILGNESYADVRLDARVQSRAGTPNSIGLICRYSEANGWYEFNVSADGTYNVLYGQWLAQGVARYTPLAIDTSEYLRPGGADNEIGLTCQGTTLWLYINGKLFRKLNETRFGLTEGKVGLTVSSFENTPVTASFDWVRVEEPDT